MWMVSSVNFLVLFNGSPMEAFKPTRGNCQVDPISLYFFLLEAYGFTFLLKIKKCFTIIEPTRITGGQLCSEIKTPPFRE
jgi:hypothetical protein